MNWWKRPLWRVPIILACTGLICRLMTYLASFVWVRMQLAKSVEIITTGYLTEMMSVVAFVLFWAAGWRFLRGLSRREIFQSATIMVVWGLLLLAGEQLLWAAMPELWSVIYRLQATTDSTMWVHRLLIHATGTVSVPLAAVSAFAPYLYLVLGRKKVREP